MRRTRSCELFIDGASRGNPGPSGIGVVCFEEEKRPAWQLAKPIGLTTNNVAVYLALIYGLEEALSRGVCAVAVKTDSELLARQVNGQYRVKDEWLKRLHALAMQLQTRFNDFQIQHIPREQNRLADRLAGEAADHAVL